MLSGLTIRGRCLLAAGIAATGCALVLDERDLLRIAAFIVALPLVALLLSRRARVALTAHREVAPNRVPVGEQGSVRLRIRGKGYLPTGGMLLRDEVPPALGHQPHFRLDEAPHRGVALEYNVRPELRGVHQVGPLRTRVTDPLGLSEVEQEMAGNTRLIAHPRVVPLGAPPVGSGLGTDGQGSTRLRAGHGEDDVMVRHYRHGDDIRRVHWKSTARRDELMVRVEEQPWYGGVTVLLDRRSAAHRGNGARSSLEWAISATASICSHLNERGTPTQLVTEDSETLSSGLGGSTRASESMLDSLATVRASAQRDLVCERDPGNGQELIAVLGATTAVGVGELTRLRPQAARSLAILLDVRAWQPESTDGGFDPKVTARRLRAVGWTVAVVDSPRVSMATVWASLSQRSSSSGIAS